MTLLDFARGPALQWSLYIMLFGVLWRIVGSVLIMAKKDLSTPRKRSSLKDGFATIGRRSLPTPAFEHRIRFQHISGYAWHLALFIAVLFFAPHIVFFESVLGFSWPHLPNTIILFAAAVATGVLIALLFRRASHPVQRHISNADDYISKDASLDYVLVRIEALFRRLEAIRGARSSEPAAEPGLEGIEFDETYARVFWKGEPVDMPLTHYWIVRELCRLPGQVRSHRDLMKAASLVVEPNTIAAHVKSIRQAFTRNDPEFHCIRTERGRGYRWVSD